MFREKFQTVEIQMRAKLDEIRKTFSNAGDKGAKAEEEVRSFLRDYLPRRLEIGHGEVIDSYGNRSRQTDVIIATEDHPFTFTRDKPSLFFIEGICAAGEVKMALTSQGLIETIANSSQYKQLKADFGKNTQVIGGSLSEANRFFKNSPYFLFAFESQISLDTIETKLKDNTSSGEKTSSNILDAVFILNRGFVINLGDGQEMFSLNGTDGQLLTGWFCANEPEQVLFWFAFWLSYVATPRKSLTKPILPAYLYRDQELSKKIVTIDNNKCTEQAGQTDILTGIIISPSLSAPTPAPNSTL